MANRKQMVFNFNPRGCFFVMVLLAIFSCGEKKAGGGGCTYEKFEQVFSLDSIKPKQELSRFYFNGVNFEHHLNLEYREIVLHSSLKPDEFEIGNEFVISYSAIQKGTCNPTFLHSVERYSQSPN